MNDVIRLDELGVCAVGLGSSKATQQQVGMLVKFAQQVSEGRIMLMPDCDDEGESGFKNLLWQLTERGSKLRIGMSRFIENGNFIDKTPEDLTPADWNSIANCPFSKLTRE
jgi:5S rRNA maturation endonuclease (ribonuclease M5)